VEGNSSTFFVKGVSEFEAIDKNYTTPMKFLASNQRMNYLTFRVVETILNNKLSMNAEVERLINIKTIYNPLPKFLLPGYVTNNTIFGLLYSLPHKANINSDENYNLFTVIVKRFDLGFILGVFLSWVSIFTIFFGVIVGPLMDKALTLILAETLFHLEQDMQRPSLLKFLFASVKAGVFPK
jgi:hypothetical protein